MGKQIGKQQPIRGSDRVSEVCGADAEPLNRARWLAPLPQVYGTLCIRSRWATLPDASHATCVSPPSAVPPYCRRESRERLGCVAHALYIVNKTLLSTFSSLCNTALPFCVQQTFYVTRSSNKAPMRTLPDISPTSLPPCLPRTWSRCWANEPWDGGVGDDRTTDKDRPLVFRGGEGALSRPPRYTDVYPPTGAESGSILYCNMV